MSFRRGNYPAVVYWRDYGISIVAGGAVSIACLAICGLAMWIMAMELESSGALANVAYSAGVFVAARSFGRLRRKQGIRSGISAAAGLFALCFIGALFTGGITGESLFIRSVITVCLGGIGGVGGVNR